MALFDVIMPVKNGAAYIASAIASVQAQTIKDWRLLVLDHGSTDDTAAIVGQIAQADPRVQSHCFPEAPGLSGLLNEGLALVQAPYAMRMDADDECLPDRMALTQAAFEAHPGVAIVGGQAITIDPEGRETGKLTNPCDRDVLARRVMFRNTFAHPTVCFRSQAIWDMDIRYGLSTFRHRDPLATIEMPQLAEDYLLFGELAIEGLAINVPQDLLRYRMHPGGVSRHKYADQLRLTAQVSRHLAELLSRRAGRPVFDPVPFCTHAQVLLDVAGKTDYRDDYQVMKTTLAQAGGAWSGAGGDNELHWREVFVDRSGLGIGARTLTHYLRCRPDIWELRTATTAVRRIVTGKVERMTIARRDSVHG